MFTYLKLKNFKSYKDITINFQSKKDEYKHMVAIYGANGSGKTSIAQAFLTLEKTLNTMPMKDLLLDLLEEKTSLPIEIPIKKEKMLEFIKERLSNSTLEKIIEDYKTIDSKSPMSIEYGFVINDSPGSYLMEFDNSNIIREKLEYKLNKNRVCYFDIEEDSKNINSNIFESKDFLEVMYKELEMYWGKHSFLSILLHEMDDKAASFVDSNISKNLMSVITAFDYDIGYKLSEEYENSSFFGEYHLSNYRYGIIEKSKEKELDIIERVLNRFFISLFDDVNRAYYHKEEDDDGKLRYHLVLNKTIDNEEFDIDFKYESSGTKEVLKLLPYIMMAIKGKCVIIDEFSSGIHDLLAAKLVKSFVNDIKGQLIVTTHNTLLMDHSDIQAESLYYILEKEEGKEVISTPDIEKRLHPNYNYRNRYFNHELYSQGLPKDFEMDYDELSALY